MGEEEESINRSPLLRSFEFRLLRCTLPPFLESNPVILSSNKHQTQLHSLIEDVLTSIESGNYVRALSSNASHAIFNFNLTILSSFQDSSDSAFRFYFQIVVDAATSFIINGNGDSIDDDDDNLGRSYRAFLVMMIAVSSFLCFTQVNMTGPLESLPSMPLRALASGDGGPGGWVEWEAWARNELMLAGSDLLGKFSNLQYVVFAKILLMKIKDLLPEGSIVTMYGNRSISWWLARLLLLQQKILDENSSSLFDSLQVFMRESLHHFGSLEKVRSYWGAKLPKEEALNMVSMLHLEVGMGELVYGRVDSSSVHFQKAESVSGLHLSLTGALGYRTVHQVEPKAQLLLVSSTSDRNDNTCPSTDLNLQQNVCTLSEDSLPGQDREISEASDVLIAPKFVDISKSSTIRAEDDQNGCVASLNAIQQALILAHCFSIEKSSRQDDMQRWEMTPYIEAIDSQQTSCFMIQFCCDMLRVQFESTRSHTKERALLMMEKLVQRVSEPFPGVAERIFVCYGVQVPCIPALRREYGNLLVRSGLIGEAVKVYEDLELWDNAIYCYSLLEKKAVAVDLIKMRLSERPNDPRLWCSLGDVTNDDSCYEKALEVSKNRSARAKRSLARSAYNKGEYETSKVLWESAMALNSLYPDGWFALGAAALKARDVDKSLDAFTRAVQLDPENGEAWNNIACLHMMKKKNKEAYIAFKEALKFKRNSWELWENYSHVAADINNFGQAMEALKKVLDMTNNKRIDFAILERVMQEVEVQALSSQIESTVTTSNHPFSEKCDIGHDAQLTSSDAGLAIEQGDRLLVELLGKVLQQIVKSGAGAETWGLFARWHKLKGDLTMCSEALLKQVRSYQGSDLWKDKDRFKKFAHASLMLAEVYIELASSSGSRRELITAEMHLKNTIKQAVNFSETEEIKDLQACLDKVQTRLQFLQVP